MRSKTNLRNEMNNVEREIIVKLNCTTEHFMIITISSTKRKKSMKSIKRKSQFKFRNRVI